MLHPGSHAPATLSLAAACPLRLADPDHHAFAVEVRGLVAIVPR